MIATQNFLKPEEQLELIKHGTVDFISEGDFAKKLKKSFEKKKPLNINSIGRSQY